MEQPLQTPDASPAEKPTEQQRPKVAALTPEQFAAATSDKYLRKIKGRYDEELLAYNTAQGHACQQLQHWKQEVKELRRQIVKLRTRLKNATLEREKWHDHYLKKKPDTLVALERQLRRRRNVLAGMAARAKAAEVREAVNEVLRKL